MEVLLAMAIFSVSVISLVEALNILGTSVVDTVDDRDIQEGLRSVIAEVSHSDEVRTGKRLIEEISTGVSYEVEVRPRDDLFDRDGKQLRGIFEVSAMAFREDSSGRRQELGSADTSFFHLSNP